jgi:hypothetical protein
MPDGLFYLEDGTSTYNQNGIKHLIGSFFIAHSFLEKMENGFPEYRCCVNTQTQTNVPCEHGSLCTKVISCGYVMDTDLLHVTGDYAHYKNQDLAHSTHLTSETTWKVSIQHRNMETIC